MWSWLFLLLSGLAGGYLAGLVGIGGGIVYVFAIPVALRLMGVPETEIAQFTIANSIFAIFFASASANFALFRRNNFFARPVLLIGIFSILSSLLTLEFIVNTTWYDVRKFNLAVIILLTAVLFYTLKNAKKETDKPLQELKLFPLSLIGLGSGMVASVSGLGGGILIIPMLNHALKVDIKKSSYISSGAIMITSLTMTIFNMFEQTNFEPEAIRSGYIIFPIAFVLSLGVIITSPQGVKTASLLNAKTISYIYAGILGLVILKKLWELIYVY